MAYNLGISDINVAYTPRLELYPKLTFGLSISWLLIIFILIHQLHFRMASQLLNLMGFLPRSLLLTWVSIYTDIYLFLSFLNFCAHNCWHLMFQHTGLSPYEEPSDGNTQNFLIPGHIIV